MINLVRYKDIIQSHSRISIQEDVILNQIILLVVILHKDRKLVDKVWGIYQTGLIRIVD